MKMVTKTFLKSARDEWGVIEDMINTQLRVDFYCLATQKTVRIKRGVNTCVAICETPDELTYAWAFDKAITFSVTLPERYWK